MIICAVHRSFSSVSLQDLLEISPPPTRPVLGIILKGDRVRPKVQTFKSLNRARSIIKIYQKRVLLLHCDRPTSLKRFWSKKVVCRESPARIPPVIEYRLLRETSDRGMIYHQLTFLDVVLNRWLYAGNQVCEGSQPCPNGDFNCKDIDMTKHWD